MKKFLFIGGQLNGQHKERNLLEYEVINYYTDKKDKFKVTTRPVDKNSVTLLHERYIRKTYVYPNGREIDVFVLSTLSNNEALDLINAFE